MFDPKAVAEKLKDLVALANRFGVAAEVAISAFIETAWPEMKGTVDSPLAQGVMGSLSPEFQNHVIDMVEAVRGE